MPPVPPVAALRRGASAILPVFLCCAWLLAGCSEDGSPTAAPSTELRDRLGLQPLPATPYPADNLPRQERIALGRLLFFDPILSGERDVSCGTCHHPDFGFADQRQFGAGVSGDGLGPARLLSTSVMTGDEVDLEPRNTPTIFNAAMNADETGHPTNEGFMFWDGRVKSLEVLATMPVRSREEMRGDAYPEEVAMDSVLARIASIPEYVQLFQMAFANGAIDSANYGKAVASYVREFVTRNSAYDRYVMGDDDALSDVQKQGLELFHGKAKCAECHSGPMFSDFRFVVQGVPQEGTGKAVLPGDDAGREEGTLDPADRYAFRTPTLRNVELTQPYMHDGMFGTLEEVVSFYNQGCEPRHPSVTDDMIDPRLVDPLGLTESEVFALVEFLKSLTDPGSAMDPMLLRVPASVPSGLMPVFGMGGQGHGAPAALAAR